MKRYDRLLPAYILAALAVGVLLGRWCVGDERVGGVLVPVASWMGTSFMNLLKVLVIPLVFSSLVSGVMNLGSGRHVGRLGAKTLGLYLLTTLIAVITGLILVDTIRPGEGAPLQQTSSLEPIVGQGNSFSDFIHNIFPSNIVQSMASGEMLHVILFAILFGIFALRIGAEKKAFLTQLFGAVTEMALSWWNNVLTPFLDWMVSAFGPLFAAVFAGAGDAVTGAAGVMADAVTTALRLFQGLAEFLSNVFAGDWAAAWASVQNTVTDVWAGIQSTVRGAVNGVIGFVNGMLRGVAAGINAVAAALNSLSFTVPDWVPGIGGSRFGVSIGTVTAPQIPMLASGGVIRQPTLAMMGEYAGAGSDPEIAAPQSAIAQAVSDANGDVVDAVLTAAQQIIEAIRENGGEIVIGDEAIGRAARRYNSRRAIMTGGAAY